MLIRYDSDLKSRYIIKTEKTVDGAVADERGAFRRGEKIDFRFCVPRALGVTEFAFCIARDGGEDTVFSLPVENICGSTDLYFLSLDTKDLCEADGLFYWELRVVRGEEPLFFATEDNCTLSISDKPGNRFRLLVYREDFHTPDWFPGGVMYHIFLDRFKRGEGKTAIHQGSTVNPDWEHGLPEYPEKPGGELSNTTFFGGNLYGVCEELDRLKALGVTVLYLSPVFRARSNHRYDTGDYEAVDELLGGDDALKTLLTRAHGMGIRVILDGVFNHTGDDSKYFNRYGAYPSLGAIQSEASPYRSWYTFGNMKNGYESWWGIPILPRLNHKDDGCRRYFTGEGGIAEKWMRFGVDGWRLDVADELSDEFLDELRMRVKASSDGEGILIGEVWENAADKISYGVRRRYLRGQQLDSVMNYPVRNAILGLLLQKDAEGFCNTVEELYASYPKEVSDSLMNLLGTHDTPRILTVLADPEGNDRLSNREKAERRIPAGQLPEAIRKLKLASMLQYTLFGVPSIYYGDEAGLEGYGDPFCRMPYPWGRENREILSHYRALGAMRARHPALADGDFRFLLRENRAFVFERRKEEDFLLVIGNFGEKLFSYPLPEAMQDALDPLKKYEKTVGTPPFSVQILEKRIDTGGCPGV